MAEAVPLRLVIVTSPPIELASMSTSLPWAWPLSLVAVP